MTAVAGTAASWNYFDEPEGVHYLLNGTKGSGKYHIRLPFAGFQKSLTLWSAPDRFTPNNGV